MPKARRSICFLNLELSSTYGQQPDRAESTFCGSYWTRIQRALTHQEAMVNVQSILRQPRKSPSCSSREAPTLKYETSITKALLFNIRSTTPIFCEFFCGMAPNRIFSLRLS